MSKEGKKISQQQQQQQQQQQSSSSFKKVHTTDRTDSRQVTRVHLQLPLTPNHPGATTN